MYRYDLLFRNEKTGAGNWIVGFVSLEAAKAYADRLQSARQDNNVVCTLYARTEEGDFHRHTEAGFTSVPKPEGVKYRYLVVSEDGSIGQVFEDHQGARDFMDSNPGLLLRLRAQRADGFAAPSQNASSKASGQGAPKPANGSMADQPPSKQGSRANPGPGLEGQSPQGQKRPGDKQSGRSRFSPFLAGAAGAGIGAFAANTVFAGNNSEGAAADPFATEGFGGEGTPFTSEGLSAAGLGEGSAFAGEGIADADFGEGGSFIGEGISSAGLGGGAFAADGLSDADFAQEGSLLGDIPPCDDGSMAAGMVSGQDIPIDPSQDLASNDITGLEDGFPAEDIAGDDEGGLFGTIASFFTDE